MIEVERFKDVERFIETAGSYLIRQEAAHNLIFGVCTTLMTNPDYYGEVYLAVAHGRRGVVGVAMRTGTHNLVFSQVASGQAVDALVADAHDFYGTIPGLLAPASFSQAAAAKWESLSGQASQVGMRQCVYQLDAVIPVGGVAGSMRLARDDEADRLTAWMDAFQVEALGMSDLARSALLVDLYRQGSGRGLHVWEDDGEIVAMAGYTGETPHGIRVNAVYTPPGSRRRGYASALVAALSQYLLDKGYAFCFLFTDLDNPTSNKIYQNIGYQPVCDMTEWRFSEE